MVLATESMMLAVIVLNIHYISDRPVPRWTRKTVLNVLARVLCMGQGQQRQGEVTVVKSILSPYWYLYLRS